MPPFHSPGGVDDIRSHPFFAGFNWTDLFCRCALNCGIAHAVHALPHTCARSCRQTFTPPPPPPLSLLSQTHEVALSTAFHCL
jgi:hypothetical protein